MTQSLQARGFDSRTQKVSPLFDLLTGGIIAVSLFLTPWFYGTVRFRDQLITQLFIFLIFFFCLLIRGRNIRINFLDFLVYLSLPLGIAAVIFSITPYVSLLAFLRFASLAAVFLLMRQFVNSPARLRQILVLMVIAGLFYSLYGLAQYKGLLPRDFWYQKQSLASRFVNGSHYAVFVLFPMWAAVSLSTASKVWLSRIFWGLLAVFQIGVMFLTQTRAVWVAFLAGGLFFLSIAVKSRIFSKKTVPFLFTGLIAAAVFFVISPIGQKVIARIAHIWQSKFYSLDYRWQLWQGCFQAIMDRPFGWGPGTYSFVMPRYRMAADRFEMEFAHNEFLQIGVELGWAGILLASILSGLLFLKLIRYFFKQGADEKLKGITLGLGTLVLTVLLASQADFPLHIFANGLYFSITLGLIGSVFEMTAAESRSEEPSFSFFRKMGMGLIRLSGALVMVGISLVLSRQLNAENYFQKGIISERNKNWAEAVQFYNESARLIPYLPQYFSARGKVLADHGVLEDKSANQKEAITALEKSLAINPHQADVYYLLGRLYEQTGNIKQAAVYFMKAVDAEPLNALRVSEFGYFAARHQMKEDALKAFQQFRDIPFQEGTRSKGCRVAATVYKLTQDYDQLRSVVQDDWRSLRCLGVVYADNGEWELAKKGFYTAIDEFYRTRGTKGLATGVRVHFAQYLSQKGRLEDAFEIYQYALKKDPGSAALQNASQDIQKKINISRGAAF